MFVEDFLSSRKSLACLEAQYCSEQKWAVAGPRVAALFDCFLIPPVIRDYRQDNSHHKSEFQKLMKLSLSHWT